MTLFLDTAPSEPYIKLRQDMNFYFLQTSSTLKKFLRTESLTTKPPTLVSEKESTLTQRPTQLQWATRISAKTSHTSQTD